MIDYAAMYADLSAVIAQVLTEVSDGMQGGGVWESDQIERTSFERLPAIPYAVIECEGGEGFDRLLNVEGYDVAVTIHYVCRARDGVRGEAQVRARLSLLAAYLFSHDPTGYDLMKLTGSRFGTDHPANEVFVTKGMPLVAGSIELGCVLSDTGS